MIAELGQLAEPLPGALWSFFLVFLRISAIAALLPAFGEQSVPARARLGVAFAFSLIVWPSMAPVLPAQPTGLWSAIAQGGAEVAAGLFFGLILRFFVMALQIAGTIAAQSTTLTQLFGGSPGVEPQPAIGHLLVVGGLALATLMGLHVQAASFMIQSYELIPPGRLPDPAEVMAVGIVEISRTFALAVSLAAPFVAGALVYNLIMGVINRAMPQLMVTFVGAPLLTAAGLALLFLAAPAMLQVWANALFATLSQGPGA
jgi:flagellar biosynthesis protein FliR